MGLISAKQTAKALGTTDKLTNVTANFDFILTLGWWGNVLTSLTFLKVRFFPEMSRV